MHISEGILSAPVLIGGAILAAAGTGIGLKKLNQERMVHVAILASAFFVASLIHVNIGPSSTHLILNGIVGLLLGFAAFPAILIALLLQSILFQFGGLTALGVNTVLMAAPAVAVHYFFLPMMGKTPRLTFTAGFLSGMTAIFLSALLLGIALWLADENFFKVSLVVIIANIPIMIIEGIVTGFCISFLFKVYPEILPKKEK